MISERTAIYITKSCDTGRKSSVRIDNRHVERLLFTEHEDGIEVRLLEIDSNHYGNKR